LLLSHSMAHDPGPSPADDDKIARILTSDSASRQDGAAQGGGTNSRPPPIQVYDIERVEKVYRSVHSPPSHTPSPLTDI
jgi:hypothetical protein